MKGWRTLVFLIPLSLPFAAIAQEYSVLDLGSFGSGSFSIEDVNDLGWLTGSFVNSSGQVRAYVKTESTFVELGAFGGQSSGGFSLSNSGYVAGQFLTGDGHWQSFRYSQAEGATALVSTGGETVLAWGVNDSGVVVGQSNTSSMGPAQAVSWSTPTTPMLLDHLGGGVGGVQAVSDIGLVGFSRTSAGVDRASVWDFGGAVTELGSLGGYSYARSISDNNMIVGSAQATSTSGHDRAFVWTESNGFLRMEGLSVVTSFAWDVNNAGEAIGEYLPTGGSTRLPFVWDAGTGMRDLHLLLDGSGTGWTLDDVSAINNLGQIVGVGTFNGQTRGFLLNPVPEPATIAALGLGLALLARRKRPA